VEGEPIYYKKHKFTEDSSTVEVITDQIPATAGIDPYLVLMDRGMDDNICEVEKENVAD
jgi:hypothetical protein